MYPQRNKFEMAAHEVDVKWNSPLEKLKRAVEESKQLRENTDNQFKKIWGLK